MKAWNISLTCLLPKTAEAESTTESGRFYTSALIYSWLKMQAFSKQFFKNELLQMYFLRNVCIQMYFLATFLEVLEDSHLRLDFLSNCYFRGTDRSSCFCILWSLWVKNTIEDAIIHPKHASGILFTLKLWKKFLGRR